MEAVAAAAAADMVDLNTLSRRELQALCKLNGVRANMTNLAMVDALHSLPSVDGIDQIGTTLCLPTPGKSAMKSALRTAAASEQQQGSPLPRGRRVSVKSPEAIRMDAMDEEGDETKRDFVRTPGVALRSTSRRARATPAPLPTPAAGTLRRSQRSTLRKAAAPVEETEVSTAKRSTRKTAIPKVAIDFDQEEEDAAVATQEEDKAQHVEREGLTSDEKCDGTEVEEVTKLPEEGNSKGDEPEQGEEGAAAIEEEEKLVNAEKFAPLLAMEDSPILGVLSKEAPEPDMKNVANSSTEDREVLGSWSPVREIADEINNSSEDKEDVAVEVPEEAIKEDATNSTVEDAVAPSNIAPAAMTEKEVTVDESVEEYNLVAENREEADLTEQSREVGDLDQEEEDMLKADRTVDEESDETIEAAAAPNKMIPAAVTEMEVAVDEVPQADLTDDESADEYDQDGESSEEADLSEESSEVDDLDEEEEHMLKADQTVDEESDYTVEVSGSTGVNTGEETKEVEDSDSLRGEEDDFSGDLSSEFDDLGNFSDVETESDSSPVALEGIHVAGAAVSSEAKEAEESVITEDTEVPSEEDVVSQHVETIVESLDKELKVGKEMSLRKLKSAYKESLIAAKGGKTLTIASDEGSRVALAELDNNAEC